MKTRILALALSVVVTFCGFPSMNVVASEKAQGSYVEIEEITDTEVNTTEDVTESVRETEETIETESEAEEGTAETESGAEEGTAETESGAEEGTIETESGAEEETAETESGAEEETTEADILEEETEEVSQTMEKSAETEEATMEEHSEELFPGLESSNALSAEQLKDKKELDDQSSLIEAYKAGEDYVEGEIIVYVSSEEEAEEFAKAYNGVLTGYNGKRGIAKIRLAEGVTVVAAVNASKANSATSYMLPAAWPNYLAHTCSDMTEVTPDSLVNPQDPEIELQWHHEYIGSRFVWAKRKTGIGVEIAVIDTGVYGAHKDLDAQLIEAKAFIDGVESEGDKEDYKGHGTHVAGIIAAEHDNDIGGCGVAPESKIRSYRVFGPSGGATTWDIILAVDEAVEDGNDIINMSLGGPGYTRAYHNALKDAVNNGVAVFVAAGNEYSNSADVYPANFPEVCTVAAINQSGGATTFSNFGSHVDLAFPGEEIYSTYNENMYSYTNMSGTSMATPVAAGVAAVILQSYHPELAGKTGASKVNALIKLMKKHTIPSSSAGMGKGTTYIPFTLGLTGGDGVPNAPILEEKDAFNQGEYVFMRPYPDFRIETDAETVVYYTVNGKTPVFKNGKIVTGILYTEPFNVFSLGKKTFTVKAIAVNPITGKVSKVASQTYKVNLGTEDITIGNRPSSNVFKLNTSFQLKAVSNPSYIKLPKNLSWQVFPADTGVTVNSEGKVVISKEAASGDYSVYVGYADSEGEVENWLDYFEFVVNEEPYVNKVTAIQKSINVTMTYLDMYRFEIAPGYVYSWEDHVLAEDKYGFDVETDYAVQSSNYKVVNRYGRIVGPGTAKVTLTAMDGSQKKATLNVKVNVLMDSVELSGPKVLATGKSITLTPDIFPDMTSNKKLDWHITPKNAGVTVKNGKVSASSKADTGEYSIWATAKDGSKVTSERYTVKVISGKCKSISLPKSATIFRVKGVAEAPTSYQIEPVITGEKGYDSSQIVYTSSNPQVASVDQNGFVKAKAVGKTTITVAAMDGSNKKAKMTIYVNIPMSGITIAPKGGATSYIAMGKKVSLGTMIDRDYGEPTNKKLIWKSDDEKIATVDQKGNVKGIAPGTTKITVRAADGSNVSASYSVTVVSAPKYFNLVAYKNELYTDGQLLGLAFDTDAGIIDNTYGYKVEISGGKGGSVYQNYGNGVDVLFTKSGTYTVKVTLLDGSKKTAKYRIKVRL